MPSYREEERAASLRPGLLKNENEIAVPLKVEERITGYPDFIEDKIFSLIGFNKEFEINKLRSAS